MSADVIRQMVASFGLQIDEAGATKADSMITGLISKAKALGAAFVASKTVGFLANIIDETNAEALALKKVSDRVGISADALEKFQYIAEASGADVDQFNQALQKFTYNVGQARTGSAESAAAFSRMGVSLKDANGNATSTEEVFTQFITKLADTKDPAERLALTLKAFGRNASFMIDMVKGGAVAIDELGERFDYLDTDIDAKIIPLAIQYTRAIKDMHVALGPLYQELVFRILPALTKAANSMVDFIVEVRKFVAIELAREFGNADKALQRLTNNFPEATKAAEEFGSTVWQIIDDLTPAMALVATAIVIAQSPFAVLITLGIALVAIIEDIVSGLSGNNSMVGAIGDALTSTQLLRKGWGAVASVIEYVTTLIQKSSVYMKGFFAQRANIFNPFHKQPTQQMTGDRDKELAGIERRHLLRQDLIESFVAQGPIASLRSMPPVNQNANVNVTINAPGMKASEVQKLTTDRVQTILQDTLFGASWAHSGRR